MPSACLNPIRARYKHSKKIEEKLLLELRREFRLRLLLEPPIS